ncbi:MAG: DUF4147 domain-containing protein, partial [Thermoplasmata archaeon]
MITNADDLVANRTSSVLRTLRRDVLGILDAALRAVDSEKLLEGHLHRKGDLLKTDGLHWDLGEIDTLRLLAIGKASLPMMRAALRLVEPEETLIITAAEEVQEAS